MSDFDQPVSGDDPAALSVIQAVTAYKTEADDARRERLSRNRINRDMYLGRQDWSHKQQGMSREFLPKIAVSVEQMASFVKRGLVQFGDWYSVLTDRELEEVISPEQIRSILDAFLRNLWGPSGKTLNIANVLSDAVKNGLLESLMILKVHGSNTKTRRFVAEKGDLLVGEDGTVEQDEDSVRMEETDEWRLRIDLVRPEDYYPDPTGNGLYEIHDVERDLHEVVAMAEQGIYDMEVVQNLINVDFPKPSDEERTDQDRNQQESTPPGFRKRVRLTEFWGTILNSDGTIAHRNVVTTVANDRFLIRPPEPNPFWHQESPFVAEPLIRVPWSVWHKALYDHASSLNMALNEVFNLILDGGISSVWGIKQIRLEDLEDPSQVAGGIQQGMTLAVKSTLPHNAKVLDTVSEGKVPPEAMAVYESVNREFTQAALTNELKLGQMPAKQVLATEVMEASQSQSVTLDGLVADLEAGMIPQLLRKAWLTILQNADEVPPDVLQGLTDKRVALIIMRASPAERFAMFASRCKFHAFGLSATMAKAREFQKVMALVQSVNMNPLMLQAFMKRFSADRTLSYLMRILQINPDDIEKSSEELQDEQMQEEQQRTQQAAGMIGGQQSMGGPGTGGEGAPAEVNQMMNPLTGMTPGS